MKQNRSGLGEKAQTGQSLSTFCDAIMINFDHILRTRAISTLNVLETACGGRHRYTFSGCSELKLRSRCDLNLIDDDL